MTGKVFELPDGSRVAVGPDGSGGISLGVSTPDVVVPAQGGVRSRRIPGGRAGVMIPMEVAKQIAAVLLASLEPNQ
jgi:hypothetical protein